MTRQSIDNLHLTIATDVVRDRRIVVDVIDPSPGLFGGAPQEGLVTVVYQCHCDWAGGCGCTTHKQPDDPKAHTHHALYGPADEQTPTEDRPVERYTLYAD